MQKKITSKIRGGMNQKWPYNIPSEDAVSLVNCEYNIDGKLASRRGYRTFGSDVGSAPITSYYYYMHQDTRERVALANAGSILYVYDEANDEWDEVYWFNHEYETIPWLDNLGLRTRWDYVPYKGICYMSNGVSPYLKYDPTTNIATQIGVWYSGTVTVSASTNLVTRVAHGYTDNYEIYILSTSSTGTMTVDATTNICTVTGHWYSSWDVVIISTSGSVPWWLTARKRYYVSVIDANTFYLRDAQNGSNIDITSTGSGTHTANKVNNSNMPWGITAGQVYYVKVSDVDNFYLTKSPNGDALDITSAGSGTFRTYDLTERRMRYGAFVYNRLYSAGDDKNASTMYYTNVNPTDATNPNQNSVDMWADDIGRITWLYEYRDWVIVMWERKAYYFEPSWGVQKIDTQGGMWWNRFVKSVDNSTLYVGERGIEVLKYRDGVGSVDGLMSAPISSKLPYLLQYLTNEMRGNSAGWLNKRTNKYMMVWSNNGLDELDKIVCYDVRTGAFSEYDWEISVYDFGIYITAEGYEKQIFTADNGQCYEYDYGWTDNGAEIESLVETGWIDFNNSTESLEVEYVEWSGWIESSGEVTMDVTMNNDIGNILDGVTISVGDADYDSINIGISGNYDDWGTGKTMYKVVKRFPIYRRASAVKVYFYSSDQWILEWLSVVVGGVPYDLFPISQIG